MFTYIFEKHAKLIIEIYNKYCPTWCFFSKTWHSAVGTKDNRTLHLSGSRSSALGTPQPPFGGRSAVVIIVYLKPSQARMATCNARTPSGHVLCLPIELQLRVLEILGGHDLCAVEASCRDLRRLVSGNSYLFHRALLDDFSCVVSTVSSTVSWKAQYVEMFISSRLETLEKQRRICDDLRLRVDELDNFLGEAGEIREVLGAPELLTSEPSLVLAIVGDMEQEVLQQRWNASEDLIMAESKLFEAQADVQTLLARIPRHWWPAALYSLAGSLAVV